MRFIKDFHKFKEFRIDEKLESGQFLVYHRTRLKEETYIIDGTVDNLYDKLAKKTIPSSVKGDSDEYERAYKANFELLKDMNPHIKLDDSGNPIFKIGDKVVTSDPRIMSQGFRPGSGDWYGVGVYTCYEFEDQIRDFDGDGKVDMAMYGPNIVEFRVQNNKKFLILDMTPENNQAKKVWGQSHTLIDQLKKIMGGKFLNFYNKNKELIDGFNEILIKTKVTTKSGIEEELRKDEQGRFLTASIGLKLAEMPGFISYVDGMSFTGGNDGKVLVIYNANLAKPTRYTPDDGKTWLSMEKMEYQYEKVKVGGEEIIQCKIIDTDKELNQISLERPNSSKWIVSLDIPTILKDKDRSIKMFSEITLNKKQFKDNLDKLVTNLAKSPKQLLDNIIKRTCELPTDISQLSSIENKLGNYYSSLVYFISELGKKSNYEGDLISKKSSEIISLCDKNSDKLSFPLDLIFNLLKSTSPDKYKDLFTNLVTKSKTFTSGELNDRLDFDDLLKQMTSDSEKYPDWFNELLLNKIDIDIQDNFKKIDMSRPSVGLSNNTPSSRFNHLVSKQILMGNNSNLNKFCEILQKDISGGSFRFGEGKLSNFYKGDSSYSLLSTSYYSYPTSWGKVDNWMIPKVVKLSDKLSEKEIDILSDFCILFLSRMAKDEDYKFSSDSKDGAKKFLAETLQGTPVYNKIIEKITKLKKEGEFEIFGVEDNVLKKYYTKFYNDISKYIKLDDSLQPDLDYKYIADSMFKSMYGPGTRKEDLMFEFKKLRNKKDLDKVIAEFGERKGMIGRSYNLNGWIKDELNTKDIEVLNNMLSEKGIDYRF